MPKKNSGTTQQFFGLFSLIMITIGAVDSIRNLPTAALFGSSLVFFFLLGALLFLLPSALIASELASTWPECGGVYIWVKHAFGKKIGFLAVWFQWMENVIWFPTVLSFIAGSIGYLISPDLANNKLFLISIIITAFWLVTIINLYGMRSSIRISNFCTIFGLLIPMLIIIALGIDRIIVGHHIQFQLALNLQSFKPNLENPQIWVALTGIMLSYCGMEITTVHAHEVHHPHRNFPRALLTSTVVLLITLICGSLAIALVLPAQKINLIYGVMQAFDAFFSAYHLHWILPVMALALVLGSIGSLSSWIIAPTRGLLIAAHDGHLPEHCRKQNTRGAPSTLLIYQAIIVTVIVLIFWVMPSASGSYWLLTSLAAQLYMLMYILMFFSAIYLRFKEPNLHRPFKIPGGKIGIIIVGGLGMIGAGLTFSIGFIPPHNINIGSIWRYEAILIGGLALAGSLPFLWKKQKLIAQEMSSNES